MLELLPWLCGCLEDKEGSQAVGKDSTENRFTVEKSVRGFNMLAVALGGFMFLWALGTLRRSGATGRSSDRHQKSRAGHDWLTGAGVGPGPQWGRT
jgi:hypothetical protein